MLVHQWAILVVIIFGFVTAVNFSTKLDEPPSTQKKRWVNGLAAFEGIQSKCESQGLTGRCETHPKSM